MIDTLRDQQPSGANQHQQRALSLPPSVLRSDISKTMGKAYRTPSPAPEPYHASGMSLYSLV
jgi:hypothetical protein